MRKPNFIRKAFGVASAGVFLLIPLLVVVILVIKVYQTVIGPTRLIAAKVGIHSLLTVQLLLLLAFALICYAFGLLVEAKFVARLRDGIENHVLRFLPGYEFMKMRLKSILGGDEDADRRAILVKIDDGWSPAFMMEAFAEGQWVVFVPDVPKSSSGSVYVVDDAQVRFLHISFNELDLMIRNFGTGLSHIGTKYPDLLKEKAGNP